MHAFGCVLTPVRVLQGTVVIPDRLRPAGWNPPGRAAAPAPGGSTKKKARRARRF